MQFNYLSLQEFVKTSNTCDLLLMRGHSFTSKLQRMFTKATHDHVVLLIKDYYNTLYIFESNQASGVNIYPWSEFVSNSCLNSFEQISYRKLVHPNAFPDLDSQMQDFIVKTINMKYHYSFCKMLCSNNKSKEWDKMTGYSCSMLVAAALINLGIIEYSKPLEKFMPGDFSAQSDQLNINKGAKFSEEIILDFTEY